MIEKVTLLDLPLVLFRSVLELLYEDDFDSFGNLRLVSRACRAHSEALIFRTLTLHKKTPAASGINSALMQRLQDPQDPLSQHVRHFGIGPFKTKGDCPSADALENILQHFDNLQSFSWNVGFPISKGVLDRFHASWPSARLHARMVDRFGPDVSEYRMDRPLLSSPQLYSLDIRLYCDYMGLSELPTLKNCIVHATGLKVLRFNTGCPDRVGLSDWSEGPNNFHFQDGDVMPALEELRVPQWRYDLTDKHCQQWKDCMDWSRLLRLDLDERSPRNLMLALTGKVPNLQGLKLGLAKSQRRAFNTDLDVAGRFLASIDGLRELTVQESEGAVLPVLWPSFLEKHGNSLRTLCIKLCWDYYSFPGNAKGWETSDFAYMLEKSPKLESLAVNLALEQRAEPVRPRIGTEQSSWMWPKATHTVIVQFQHLRHLVLSVLVDESYDNFFSLTPRALIINEQYIFGIAIGLFNQFIQSNQKCAIEDIQLVLFKRSPANGWRFTVKRVWGASQSQERFVTEKSSFGNC